MPSLEGCEHVGNVEAIHHGMTRRFAEVRGKTQRGLGGFLALRKMLCAVLLCRLSIGDSSPPKNMVVSGQCTQCAPREGEAPAEPK
jgi:hypothetical protein